MDKIKIQSKVRTLRQVSNQARNDERISDLRSRLLDIVKNYDYKLTTQGFTKLTKDITGASRLIKLQNIEKEYVEGLRSIKTNGKKVSLLMVSSYRKDGGENEQAAVSKIQQVFRNRVKFKMVNQTDVKSAMHGMVRQIKIEVGSLGRDVNDNIPLILTTAFQTAIRELEMKPGPNDKFYGKLSATVSKNGDSQVLGFDTGVFKVNEMHNWAEASREQLMVMLQSEATVSFTNSIFTFSFMKEPAGGRYIFDPTDIELNCVISRTTVKCIKNTDDNDCFWNALLVSQNIGNENVSVDKCNTRAKTMSKALCLQCGFEPNEMVELASIAKIEDVLNENICVLNIRNLPIIKADINLQNHLLYTSKHRGTRTHWLLFDPKNLHFHVISDIRKFFKAKHFCEKCFKCIKNENTYAKHCVSLCGVMTDTTIQPIDKGKKLAKDSGCYMRGAILYGSNEEIQAKIKSSPNRTAEDIEDQVLHTEYIFYDIETDTNLNIGTDKVRKMLHRPMHIEVLKVKVAANHKYEDSSVESLSFTGYDCIDLFGNWLFTEQNKNNTVMAYNGSGYDNKFILKWCLEHGLEPSSIIEQGTGITYLRYKKFNIRFIDPCKHMNARLKDLPKMLGLGDLKKGDFPHMFNTPENQNYIGPIPDIKYYGVENKSVKEAAEFRTWYAEQLHITDWNFREEMISYCKDDVKILAKGVLAFREMFMRDKKLNLDPFRYITLAGVSMAAYKGRFMPNKTIVSNGSNKAISKTSREWFKFLNNKDIKREQPVMIELSKLPVFNRHEGKIIICDARGNPKEPDEIYIGNVSVFTPDGLDKKRKIVYEFYGDYYHGCPKHCSHAVNKYNATIERENILKAAG